MELIKKLDEEIAASRKSAQSVNIRLSQSGPGVYKGFLPFKIEGDYVLNSKTITDKGIVAEWNEDHVIIELDSEEEKISAFLTKDESSILRAVKTNLQFDGFKVKPSFIVGPPGTGKTKVITEILKETTNAKERVLLLSPTNMAVENVFERLDLVAMKLKPEDVVLTIKTEQEALKELSPESIKAKKLEPIEDELEVLNDAKAEMLRIRRDAQPNLELLKSIQDATATQVANFKRDLNALEVKLKSSTKLLAGTENRIKALTGNALLKTVAQIVMRKKVEELTALQTAQKIKINAIEAEISKTKLRIVEVGYSDSNARKDLENAKEEILEANDALGEITCRIKELRKQAEELKNNDVYSKANIVGATLVNAALNKRIQDGEFDKIIVDEASMALVPLLVVAAQSLNNKELKQIARKDNPSLYEAQNRAVDLALKSKLIFVGDPKQLQPIAKTYDMKQSVFNLYGVDRIFEGEAVEDTVFLDMNFRNHPHITFLASKLFYGGLLKSGKEDDGKDSLFIKRSTSKMVSTEGSYINHGNMKVVTRQVESALAKGRRSVGVITPYRKQANLINEAFEKLRVEYPDADIQAGTIHTFQGKEKDIIIYDLTFSPSEYNNGAVPATYNGDIDSDTAKLLNVAMTRAEGFFIVVGDVEGILELQQPNLVLKEWLSSIVNL